MATKSRFPNLGNVQKEPADRAKCEGNSSNAAGEKRQITLSRFFKLLKKQVPSGSAYDGDSVHGDNNTQPQVSED